MTYHLHKRLIFSALIPLLFINPFLPLLPLSGEVKPLFTIFVIAYTLLSIFLGAIPRSSYPLVLSLITALAYCSIYFVDYSNPYFFLGVLSFLQLPFYLLFFNLFFATSYTSSIFFRRTIYLVSALALLSFLLFKASLFFPGLSGIRTGLSRGGGIPFYAPEPSANLPLVVFLLVTYISLYTMKIRAIFDIPSRYVLLLTAIFLLGSSSGLVALSIFLIIVLTYLALALHYLIRLITTIKPTLPVLSLTPRLIFVILLILLSVYLVVSLGVSKRLSYILTLLLNADLLEIIAESSHRPAFFLASFLPDSLSTLIFGHGPNYWYGNYIDSVNRAAQLIGQKSGLGLLTASRIAVTRPPSTIAFTFYSFGVTGLIFLFTPLYLFLRYWTRRIAAIHSISPFLIIFISLSSLLLLLIPGLAFNPLNFSPPLLLIFIYHHYSHLNHRTI